MIPSPQIVEEAFEAAFSGSLFMRICMPPLLFVLGAFASLISAGEFLNGRIGIHAFVWGAWGAALLLGVVAAAIPDRTRKIRGVIAVFIGSFFAVGSICLWVTYMNLEFAAMVVIAIAFSLGAFSYARHCFLPQPR